MQEININQENKEKPEVIMPEAPLQVPKPSSQISYKPGDDPKMADKVDLLWNDAINIIKRKPLKIMRKAKVTKRKAKKGWVGILKVDENGNISGEKVQLRDSAFMTRDKLFHATDGREMLMYDGKFPCFIQEAKKDNPKKFLFNEGKNETYGQPYIMAKMLLESVKPKRGGMGIVLILLAVGAGIFLINKFMGGG